ncbi:hypothetical protein MSAN_02473400 [Mycena sanguinolenta]|uniref:Uncharacterized protein n=1 Tax=Mycena sanguinolenta TaxID=230812 RepID=A0A8H6U020_9AGAR|nr:hypothetical protein MSAN_02473400 [Mycena sanguinolenta]
MSTIPETSLSILSQSNPPSTTWTFTGILLAISAATAAVYYASPTHLTRVLVSALADTEKAYFAAAENGVLCVSTADVAERLSILQLKVSALREASLRSSISLLFTLCDTFNVRRSFAVLRCLGEVRELGTHIEISNETQLREINSHPLSDRTTISLRRRGSRV